MSGIVNFILNGQNVSLLVYQLKLALTNYDILLRREHVLTLGVILPAVEVHVPVPFMTYVLTFVTLLSFTIIMALVWFCIFQTTHRLIRPLRQLNERMLEMLEEGNADIEINITESCSEIKQLNHMFIGLIKDKQFSNNDFLHKEEALAIIDLAELCSNFEKMDPPNHKFAGICYNNIANLQFKNGKYSVAHENYQKAIEKAEICALEVYQRAKVT